MHLQVGYGGYGVIWLTPNHKKKKVWSERGYFGKHELIHCSRHLARAFGTAEKSTEWGEKEKEGQEEEQRAKGPQGHQKAQKWQEEEEGQADNHDSTPNHHHHHPTTDHNTWGQPSTRPGFYLNDLDLNECCWPCVCLLPAAIPTEPPAEPYTDYPYPDIGEWNACGEGTWGRSGMTEISETPHRCVHIFFSCICYLYLARQLNRWDLESEFSQAVLDEFQP